MKQKFTAVLFVLTLFGFSLATLFSKDREFSEMENRMLDQRPEFRMEGLLDGEYGKELEEYLADQIVFKDALVVAKNHWERLLGKQRMGEVYYTKSGRYLQEHRENAAQLGKNMDAVAAWCRECGAARTFFMLVPTAVQIYEEALPLGNLNEGVKQTLAVAREKLGDKVRLVYAADKLAAHKEEEIYYRTDHHWTMAGAYYGYEMLCEVMGLKAQPWEDFREIGLKDGFLGSLYSQAPFLGVEADSVVFYEPVRPYKVFFESGGERSSFLFEENFTVKDKYTALFNGNYGRIELENQGGEGTLLVFKDSYANSMVPYLIGNYQRVIMIDLRFYGGNLKALYKEVEDADVLFLYNTDFINTNNDFWKLSY